MLLKYLSRLKLPSILILGLLLSFFVVSTVSAHPGNTAADGGHYCRTNCASWGEVYGERHFHGGSGSFDPGPSYTEQGTENGAKHATSVNRAYIETHAETDGKTNGHAAGHEETSDDGSFPSDTVCTDELEFTNISSIEYIDAFKDSYVSECENVYMATYRLAYATSFEEGAAEEAKERAEELALTKIKEVDEEGFAGNWFLWLIGALFAVALVRGFVSELQDKK